MLVTSEFRPKNIMISEQQNQAGKIDVFSVQHLDYA